MDLLLSLLAAGAYTVGGLFMRKADGFTHALPAAIMFGCFCVGAVLQTLAMKRSELSINYILVLGLEAVLALVLGIGWLGEALSPRKLTGVALILAGVMSLRVEGKPKSSATPAPAASVPAPGQIAFGEATPRDTPSPTSRRRPCQNLNHAPCR